MALKRRRNQGGGLRRSQQQRRAPQPGQGPKAERPDRFTMPTARNNANRGTRLGEPPRRVPPAPSGPRDLPQTAPRFPGRQMPQIDSNAPRQMPGQTQPRGPQPQYAAPTGMPDEAGYYYDGGEWKFDPRLAALGITDAGRAWQGYSGGYGDKAIANMDPSQLEGAQMNRQSYRDALRQQGLLDNFQKMRRNQGMQGRGNFDDALLAFADRRIRNDRTSDGAYVTGYGNYDDEGPGGRGRAIGAGQFDPQAPWTGTHGPIGGQAPAPAQPQFPPPPQGGFPPGLPVPGGINPGGQPIPQPQPAPMPAPMPAPQGPREMPGVDSNAPRQPQPQPLQNQHQQGWGQGPQPAPQPAPMPIPQWPPPQPGMPPSPVPQPAPGGPVNGPTGGIGGGYFPQQPQPPQQPAPQPAPIPAPQGPAPPQAPQPTFDAQQTAPQPANFQSAPAPAQALEQTTFGPGGDQPDNVPFVQQAAAQTQQALAQTQNADLGLPLSPEFEGARRALEDEFAATLMALNVQKEQIPMMVKLATERLATQERADLRQTDNAAISRGLFDSGIRNSDRRGVNQGYDRGRQDLAFDAAGQYSDLAGQESETRSGFAKSIADLLLQLANSEAQDERSAAPKGDGEPDNRVQPKKRPKKRRRKRRNR